MIRYLDNRNRGCTPPQVQSDESGYNSFMAGDPSPPPKQRPSRSKAAVAARKAAAAAKPKPHPRGPNGTIPDYCDPAIKFVAERVPGIGPKRDLSEKIGLSRSSIQQWLYRTDQRGPSIYSVRKALRELGFDLVEVPYEGDR